MGFFDEETKEVLLEIFILSAGPGKIEPAGRFSPE
jgi:hypothetical protein